VELLNTENTSISLTGWKLTDLATPGETGQHEVLNKELNDLTLLANGIITIDVSGLNNNGDSISLYNGINLIDQVTYGEVSNISADLSSPSKGKSGALISGSWKTNQNPTKGGLNSESSPVDFTPINGDENINNETESKPKVIENPTMKAKIVADTLAFTGESFGIKTNILGFSNENVLLGVVYWNFGDGASFIQRNNFEKFYHTYYYPGEYVLLLEYYQNAFSKTPDAINKMIVKVLPTTVTISKIGNAKDFFIELTNNATSDIDISNWKIEAGGKTFTLPKNSVILSKKQMTISGKITGFIYGDQYNLKLLSGNSELVFDYNSSRNRYTSKSFTVKTVPISNMSSNEIQNKENIQTENQNIDLASAAILSDSGNNDKKSYFFFWGFVVLLFVAGGGVYYIRQRGNVRNVGDDFKILDE
jgi:hypothetical protein